jgi:hypothetical protein
MVKLAMKVMYLGGYKGDGAKTERIELGTTDESKTAKQIERIAYRRYVATVGKEKARPLGHSLGYCLVVVAEVGK